MDASIPERTIGPAVAVTLAILVSALGSVVTAAAANAAASSSSDGSIVFVKDDDIWLTTPDGVTQRRLTTDGATDTGDLTGSNRYDSPTQSDDGQVIVAVRIEGRTGDLFRADGYLWVLNRPRPGDQEVQASPRRPLGVHAVLGARRRASGHRRCRSVA